LPRKLKIQIAPSATEDQEHKKQNVQRENLNTTYLANKAAQVGDVNLNEKLLNEAKKDTATYLSQ
jgi:hypothetical protein